MNVLFAVANLYPRDYFEFNQAGDKCIFRCCRVGNQW